MFQSLAEGREATGIATRLDSRSDDFLIGVTHNFFVRCRYFFQAQCQLTPEAEAQLKELTRSLGKDEKSLAKV